MQYVYMIFFNYLEIIILKNMIRRKSFDSSEEEEEDSVISQVEISPLPQNLSQNVDREILFIKDLCQTSVLDCCMCKSNLLYQIIITSIQEKINYCQGCAKKIPDIKDKYCINKLSFSIYSDDWTAQQQFKLLQYISKCGYGNWEQIEKKMSKSKSYSQIQKHYESIYLKTRSFIPLSKQIVPPSNYLQPQLLFPFWKQTQPVVQQNSQKKPQTMQEQQNDMQQDNIVHYESKLTNQNKRKFIQTGDALYMLGYNPKRRQFDFEYNFNAEMMLINLQFSEQDTASQTRMKEQLLRLYIKRLNQRNLMKQLAIKNNLTDLKSMYQLYQNLNSQEKNIYDFTKSLLSFNFTELSHLELLEKMIEQKSIEQKIIELKYYQSLGYNTLNQIKNALQIENQKKTQQNCVKTRKSNKKSKCEGYLTYKQKKLLKNLGIQYDAYIEIKQQLIKEDLKNGFIKEKEVYALFPSINKNILLQIFHFLINNHIILS